MTISRSLLAAAALPLFAASPAIAQEDAEPLRIVTSFEIGSMNPYERGFWMQEFGVAELLMKFEEDGGHHPWLLSSLENVDDLTWVLNVRPEVSFQNGRAMDAQAVLDAIDLQLEHSVSSRGAVPEDASFTVTGEFEITVRTETPWPSLPGALANEAGLSHF